ncbi:hypothetical protein [Cellulosimicrobium sp. Marseille-Q4280]|uniref:hypothetical protein n=1 Tax=Cellulosimicrobium sp. Marseille-Q4280 TaxID=2937992 RepID=UPI00203E273A|nr:hypothetical protein [Cellulosimicrobium sp. Marseille-Q4280]
MSEQVNARVPTLGSEVRNSSLIAEAAFALVARGDSMREPVAMGAAVESARRYLLGFSLNPPSDHSLDGDELEEVRQLADALARMTREFVHIEFWPSVPGCGVVDTGHADIVADGCIYEVKSVSRKFRASDVRQLLTYCAMFSANGRQYAEMGLINPRLGTRVNVSLEFVAQGVSGLSWAELAREIIRRMTELQVSG